MTTPDDLRHIFCAEAEELLAVLDAGLRQLQRHGDDMKTVNAVFRAVHSIKGGAAAFQLTGMVAFAHRFEDALDDLRAERLTLRPALLAALMQASDRLADLVAAEFGGPPADDAAIGLAILALETAIRPGAVATAARQSPDDALAFQPVAMSFDTPPDTQSDTPRPPQPYTAVDIAFRPFPTAFAAGHDPAAVLRDLARRGQMDVRLDASALPQAADFDPTMCYLGWDMLFSGVPDPAPVFEFIKDHCTLTITPCADVQKAAPAIPVRPSVFAKVPDAPAPHMPPRATIRVDTDRIDRLVDTLGELVIQQAMLADIIHRTPGLRSGLLDQGLDQLSQLSRDIQDGVMAIRAQPVKPLFDRMHRIAREACQASGKTARIVTEGEMTEIDKTIIERLADPLTHIIRNAVDHGLEGRDQRRSAGKSDDGVIRLSASHRSGRIIMTVQDDGAGINRDRVRQVAIERGLISPHAELTAMETDALLFLPGFSTNTAVSSLSGRGVGMDVVRSEIAGLGGRVSIASAPGRGTTLTISLPLTLAVLDGIVCEVAGQTLVLPVAIIIQSLRFDPKLQHSAGQGPGIIDLRGCCMPLIDVGAVLGFRPAKAADESAIVVVVEHGDAGALALLVDVVRDQRQLVIKGLGAHCGKTPGIAAATVLGDGSVALILDPADLPRHAPAQPTSYAAE